MQTGRSTESPSKPWRRAFRENLMPPELFWFAKASMQAFPNPENAFYMRNPKRPFPQLLFRRNQRQIQTNRNWYEPFKHFDDWDEKLREDLIHFEKFPPL
jgi:hypothetical protein